MLELLVDEAAVLELLLVDAAVVAPAPPAPLDDALDAEVTPLLEDDAETAVEAPPAPPPSTLGVQAAATHTRRAIDRRSIDDEYHPP